LVQNYEKTPMITIREVVDHIERVAPPAYQEDYDNSGLITGSLDPVVTGVLLSLDCTEEIIEEAKARNCNLVISHHPIVFRGLKKLTGRNYVERTIVKAIKEDISIYAVHTNLDNVDTGVNKKIAEKIGLRNVSILSPRKNTLLKLTTFIPSEQVDRVMEALHTAGAGNIGDYKQCSFRLKGTGHFKPTGDAQPHVGRVNQMEAVDEVRVEVILPAVRERDVMAALMEAHPYEEVAYYLSALENLNQEVGSGMIGELPSPEEPMAFLRRLKVSMKTDCIRHTAVTAKAVSRIAICGGSGRFLLEEAIRQKADVLVSADFKYHEFFDADGKIIIADVGHYESEQFTPELLAEVLREKFATFAINFSKKVTNPISYL
jgi:dinuclear metal center YbgI/SA1388 family protein